MAQSAKHIVSTGIFLLIFSCLNAQQDTVILKNGNHHPGYIYKMEADKIYLTNENDSIIYTAGEIDKLMFCHKARSHNDCAGSGKNDALYAKSSGISSHATGTKNTVAKNGYAEFICTHCGGNGRIEIINSKNPGIVIDEFLVSLNASESYFSYTAQLPAGSYEWRYCDTVQNSNKGSFNIEKGTALRIAVLTPH